MLLGIVTDHLIKIRRTKEWLEHLCVLSGIDRNGKVQGEGDVRVTCYVVDVLVSQNRVKMAL